MVEDKKELPNHIEEFMDSKSKRSDFIDLFEAKEDNVDLRTDLTHQEIVLTNVLQLNGDFMKSKGMDGNIYQRFINGYKRLKVSLDRKSRGEFVDINKKERFESNLEKFNTFANLKKVKE